MPYRLRMYAYCGMSTEIVDGDEAECRLVAARMIRRHRNVLEYPVTIQARGEEWDLQTGDDAVMVGDDEGVLTLKPYLRCEDCGREFDVADETDDPDNTYVCEDCEEDREAAENLRAENDAEGFDTCFDCGVRCPEDAGLCDDCRAVRSDDDDDDEDA